LTTSDLISFLRSTLPAHVEVKIGEDDMLCADDHEANAQAYVKYTEGLDFSVQGVRNGEKSDTRTYSFRNEFEMVTILAQLVLSSLDGERRV